MARLPHTRSDVTGGTFLCDSLMSSLIGVANHTALEAGEWFNSFSGSCMALTLGGEQNQDLCCSHWAEISGVCVLDKRRPEIAIRAGKDDSRYLQGGASQCEDSDLRSMQTGPSSAAGLERMHGRGTPKNGLGGQMAFAQLVRALPCLVVMRWPNQSHDPLIPTSNLASQL